MVARGEEILFMDSDGATKISDLEPLEADMWKLVRSGEETLGLGFRCLGGGCIGKLGTFSTEITGNGKVAVSFTG